MELNLKLYQLTGALPSNARAIIAVPREGVRDALIWEFIADHKDIMERQVVSIVFSKMLNAYLIDLEVE